MRFKGISHLLLVVIIAASIVITLPVLSFASTQAVNDAAANTKLTNIYNRLGNMYDRMAATNAYLGNIQTYTQNTQTYLQYIYGQLGAHTGYSGDIFMQVVGVQDMVQAVGGQVADVSSKLVYTNNYLSSINTNTDYVETHLANINSELSNINWNNETITYGYYPSISDAVAKTNPLAQGSYSNVFVRFDFSEDIYNKALKLVFGVIPYSPLNVVNTDAYIDCIYMVNNSNNGAVIVDDSIHRLYYNSSQRTSSFYLDGTGRTMSSGGNSTALRSLIIRISGTQNSYVFPNTSCLAYSLPFDSEDYLKLANYIKIQSLDFDSINSNIQTLVDVYASPDVIAAKEQQQAYEDQTISDFTGSGSAAASGSDATNMKNVSGAIKSGLDSGGSVSNALGVFNTSGGLWDWFSQSNYDEINGTQTRSRGSEEYIDFYNTNREELERLLMEDNR